MTTDLRVLANVDGVMQNPSLIEEFEITATNDGQGKITRKAGAIATADIADSAITTAKVAEGAISNSKLADDTIEPGKIAEQDANFMAISGQFAKVCTGASPVTLIASLPFKIRITDVKVICTNTNASGTVQLTDGTNAITDAMACDTAKDVSHAAMIDTTYAEVAAAGTLAVVKNATADDGILVVDYIRVA